MAEQNLLFQEYFFLNWRFCSGRPILRAYVLVYDIHSEFLLTSDLDEYLENEGFPL